MKVKGQPVGDGVYYFEDRITVRCPHCQREWITYHGTLMLKGISELDIEVRPWEGGFDVFMTANGVTYSIFRQACMAYRPPDPDAEDFIDWESEFDSDS